MKLSREPYYTRRIYIRDRTIVPQNTEQNVSVKMTLRTPADWVPGTENWLPGTKNCAFVQVINLSNKPYVLGSGFIVGQVTIAEVLLEQQQTHRERHSSNQRDTGNRCRGRAPSNYHRYHDDIVDEH